MEVFGYGNDPRPWTNPFPAEDTADGISGQAGFIWALRGGDVYDPNHFGRTPRPGNENEKLDWFNSIPNGAKRWYCKWPILPFFSFSFGRFGMYIGWKVYGFDAPEYKDYPLVNEYEVEEGSTAMCFSWRFSTSRK